MKYILHIFNDLQCYLLHKYLIDVLCRCALYIFQTVTVKRSQITIVAVSLYFSPVQADRDRSHNSRLIRQYDKNYYQCNYCNWYVSSCVQTFGVFCTQRRRAGNSCKQTRARLWEPIEFLLKNKSPPINVRRHLLGVNNNNFLFREFLKPLCVRARACGIRGLYNVHACCVLRVHVRVVRTQVRNAFEVCCNSHI